MYSLTRLHMFNQGYLAEHLNTIIYTINNLTRSGLSLTPILSRVVQILGTLNCASTKNKALQNCEQS